MNRKTQPDIENISGRTIAIVTSIAGVVILLLFTGYLLGLAWLLTLLAPLTFSQAAAFAFLVVASGFVILARWPRFDIPMILMTGFTFIIFAPVEVLLARLVVFITPLTIWEASLLIVGTAALLLFIVVQSFLDSGGYDTFSSEDDEDDPPFVARLSPDMYVLKPEIVETPPPKRPRTSRRRAKKESDDANRN